MNQNRSDVRFQYNLYVSNWIPSHLIKTVPARKEREQRESCVEAKKSRDINQTFQDKTNKKNWRRLNDDNNKSMRVNIISVPFTLINEFRYDDRLSLHRFDQLMGFNTNYPIIYCPISTQQNRGDEYLETNRYSKIVYCFAMPPHSPITELSDWLNRWFNPAEPRYWPTVSKLPVKITPELISLPQLYDQ